MSKVADFRAMIERDYDREVLIQLLEAALAEARAQGECEAQTEVVKGYHEYGWSHKDTVVWAMRRIEELKGNSK